MGRQSDAVHEKLKELDLEQYWDLLVKNDLDNFEVWDYLKDEDLVALGISSLGARKLLLSTLRGHASDDSGTTGQATGGQEGHADAQDVYISKGPEISFRNISTSEDAGKEQTSASRSGSSKLLIGVLIGAAVLLVFWLSGGFYHVGELNRTINRGVYNRGAERAYEAVVSYFERLPSVPFNAEFDPFSEVSVEDFGDEAYRFRFSYTYTEYLDSGREMTYTRNCMAVVSRDSSNTWRLGDHYPTE